MAVIFAASDFHPDKANPETHGLHLSFLDMICRERPAAVVFVGDTHGSIWDDAYSNLLANQSWREFEQAHKKMSNEVTTYVIDGNHDPLTTDKDGPAVQELGGGRKCHYVGEVLDGDTIGLPGWRFEHGHRQDPLTYVWDALLFAGNRTIGELATARLAAWLAGLVWHKRRTPGDIRRSALAAGVAIPERFHDMVGLLHAVHYRTLIRNGWAGLVAGHSHFPERRSWENDFDPLYANCGAMDWAGIGTWLRIDSGHVTIERWPQ